MDAGTIRILVDVDASKVGTGLVAASAAVNTFSRTTTASLNKVSTGTNAARASMLGFEKGVVGSLQRVGLEFSRLSTGQRALAGLGVGIAATVLAFKSIVGPAIEFESAFTGVLKTVEGTPAQLGSIRQGLVDLSTQMPTTAVELASIAENAGQLGVRAPDILTFTKVVAQLGETTDLSFDSAAQSLARFLNITGTGVKDIEPVSDVIVELGNNSATTESQIVEFGLRLASGLTIAGATQEEILGLASAFSSMGIRAEAGGSATTRIFRTISDAADVGGDKLAIFAETAGLSAVEFAALARSDPTEAFIRFAEGLERVNAEGEALSPIFKGLGLAGIRTSAILRAAALNTGLLREQQALANGAFEVGGQRQEEYARRAETTASRIDVLRNRFTALSIGVGTPALDLIVLAADAAGDSLVKLSEILQPLASALVDTFSNTGDAAESLFNVLGRPALGATVAALEGTSAAATGLLRAFNLLGAEGIALVGGVTLLGRGLPGLVSSFGAFTTTLQVAGTRAAVTSSAMGILNKTLLRNPFIIAAAGAAALGKALIDARQEGEAFANTLRQDIDDAVNEADFGSAVESIDELIAAQSEAQDIFLDNTAWQSGGLAIRDFGAFVDVAKGILPGFSSEVLENEGRLKALNEQLGDLNYGLFEDSVRHAANALGLSEDSIIQSAIELGVLEELVGGTTEEFHQSIDAIRGHTAAEAALADQLGINVDLLVQETLTLEQLADAIGLTSTGLQNLGQFLLGVDFGSLETEEAAAAAFLLEERLRAIAEASGVSTAAIESNISALVELAISHTTLRQAIDGTIDAYGLLFLQQQAATSAQEDFDAALAGLSSGESSLIEVGTALAAAVANTAGVNTNLGEVTKLQEQWRDAAIETAVANGKTRAEAEAIIDSFLLSPDLITNIQLSSEEYLEDAERIKEANQDLGQNINVRVELEDLASNGIDVVLARLNDLTAREWINRLRVDDQQAIAAIAGTTVELLTWDDLLAVADLNADGKLGSEEIERLIALAQAYKDGEYVAILDAETEAAKIKVGNRFKELNELNEFVAVPEVELEAVQALEDINDVGEEMDEEFRDRTTVLSLDDQASDPARSTGEILDEEAENRSTGMFFIDNASEPARGTGSTLDSAARSRTSVLNVNNTQANKQLDFTLTRLAQFRSKEITLTTRTYEYRSGSRIYSADGNVIPSMPNRRYASGGFDYGPYKRQKPGLAQIYTPVTPGRIFAEPETGGEAYIPLSPAKRNRAIPVFMETGRRLGMFNNGGISDFEPDAAAFSRNPNSSISGPTIFNVAAPMTLNIENARNLDTDALVRHVDSRVQVHMKKLATDMNNRRRY